MTIAELPRRTGTDLLDRHTDSWVFVLADYAALAQTVADTDFVPRPLRRNPAAITAAMLFGREVGLGPMQSLRQTHMIDGRPALAAEAMRALALAAGHVIEFGETTGTTCTVRGRRGDRGDASSWHTVTWTLDMAQRAGIATKAVWKAYPRAMLKARATGELCHDLFPDVIGGYAAAEESDVVDGEAAPESPAAAPEKATRTVSRKKAPDPAASRTATPPPAPDPDPAPPPVPDEPPPAAPPSRDDDTGAGGATAADPLASASDEQAAKVFALYGEIWKADGSTGTYPRDARLAIAEAITGRQLDSFRDLSRHEASQMIDTLGTLAEGPDPKGRLTALVAHITGKAATDQEAEFELIAEVDGELVADDDDTADDGEPT